MKGDPATLRCASNGENVEIKWFKDEERVVYGKHRLLLPNGSLFLLKVNNGNFLTLGCFITFCVFFKIKCRAKNKIF